MCSVLPFSSQFCTKKNESFGAIARNTVFPTQPKKHNWGIVKIKSS